MEILVINTYSRPSRRLRKIQFQTSDSREANGVFSHHSLKWDRTPRIISTWGNRSISETLKFNYSGVMGYSVIIV